MHRITLVEVTDAINSAVSGFITTIDALTICTVKVTTKDGYGNLIGHGEDKFWIQIFNQCTMTNEFTCTQVTGAKHTIVTPIDQMMTDVGDGTYTQSFSVQINGTLTIIIKLIDGNGVYWEWYANTSLSGTPEKKNVTSNLFFYEPGINWVSLPGGDDYYTAIFQSTIRPPTTEVYTFYVQQDDGTETIFNGTVSWVYHDLIQS